MKLSIRCSIVALALFVVTGNYRALHGQSLGSLPAVDSLARFEAIPNDLVFELLGLPGNSIQQPGTVSAILASLTSAVDFKGNLAPGAAITLAPYQLIMGDSLELKDYVQNPMVRILANTQISLGTAPAHDADSALDWGVGARIVIFNSGDGRLNTTYIDQLLNAGDTLLKKFPLPNIGTTVSPSQLADNTTALRMSIDARNMTLRDSVDSADVNTLTAYLKRADSLASPISDSLKAYLTPIKNNVQGRVSLRAAKKSITQQKLSPAWNTASLEINLGAVYRASSAQVGQSHFKTFRGWVNGGIGTGNSQFIGQIGVEMDKGESGSGDSTAVTSALMYRIGNQYARFGVGVNTENLNRGVISMLGEIRVTGKTWAVISFDGQVASGARPVWKPSLTLKLPAGQFGSE
ncbi:MAG: hypothetical protein JWQ98_630 [Chlorobi bacterium]|nr:hypothetical protein [Chlorobiota bacterium]